MAKIICHLCGNISYLPPIERKAWPLTRCTFRDIRSGYRRPPGGKEDTGAPGVKPQGHPGAHAMAGCPPGSDLREGDFRSPCDHPVLQTGGAAARIVSQSLGQSSAPHPHPPTPRLRHAAPCPRARGVWGCLGAHLPGGETPCLSPTSRAGLGACSAESEPTAFIMWKCQPAEGRHGRLALVEGRPEPLGDPGCRGLLESTVHWEGLPWGLEGAARMPPCHTPGHAPSPPPRPSLGPPPRTPCPLEPPAVGA